MAKRCEAIIAVDEMQKISNSFRLLTLKTREVINSVYEFSCPTLYVLIILKVTQANNFYDSFRAKLDKLG